MLSLIIVFSGRESTNGKHINENLPEQPRAFQLFFHPTFTHRQPSLRLRRICSTQRRKKQSEWCNCVHIWPVFYCFVLFFWLVPAAQPIEAALETMTPVCCWGFLKESRTRGQQTSCPTGHVTPGSGTAVTSEYNVMSVPSKILKSWEF